MTNHVERPAVRSSPPFPTGEPVMTIDKNQLPAAKKWAELIQDAADNAHPINQDIQNAAEVIRDLPDVIVDGDKLREAMNWLDSKPSGDDYDSEFWDRLQALLPAPAPRVEIALGSWAMHPELGKVLVCSDKADSAGGVKVSVKDPRSAIGTTLFWVTAADLSPVPSDTPTEQDAPTPGTSPGGILHHPSSDHSADPEPQAEDVPGGEPWEVSVGNGQEYVGIRSETGIWELFDREDGHHSRWGLPSDVTPLHRLVPEQQPRTNAEMSEDTRMTTVELPNVGDGWYRCRADHLDPFRLKRGTHKILTEREGVLVRAGSDVDFHIADNEVEEFALALLALHHKRTATQ